MADPAFATLVNRQEAVLRDVLFPSKILESFTPGERTCVTAMRALLVRFSDEAGGAGDGIERVLMDQLIVAHLKVGEMYALASETTNLDFKQTYINAAVRLVGCLCQLTAALTTYRAAAARLPRRRSGAGHETMPEDAGRAAGEPGTAPGGKTGHRRRK
jgi:hypothetical protein